MYNTPTWQHLRSFQDLQLPKACLQSLQQFGAHKGLSNLEFFSACEREGENFKQVSARVLQSKRENPSKSQSAPVFGSFGQQDTTQTPAPPPTYNVKSGQVDRSGKVRANFGSIQTYDSFFGISGASTDLLFLVNLSPSLSTLQHYRSGNHVFVLV